MTEHAPRVAIVTDEPGWHGRRLRAALAARGLAARYVSLAECTLDLRDGTAQVRMPGFRRCPPLGVFVRGIPGGTLEQIVLRLDLLHCLREQGVVVYNDARAIERTVDKALTSLRLRAAGVPTPPTWACETRDAARRIAARELGAGRRLVLKPLFGSQGMGLRLIERVEDLDAEAPAGGVFYLQRFVPSRGASFSDYRVLVIDGRACAAMRRSHRHWVTNRARGARCEAVALDAALATPAERAAQALEVNYAGVDLMEDPAGGGYQVIEVNGVPAWMGLQGTTGVDIAARLAEHFVACIAAATRLEVVSGT